MLWFYTFQLRQHSASLLCAVITSVNIFNSWSTVAFIVSWLWSQLSSLTDCTSDNQLWITLVRNDLPQFAILVYPIVAFFMKNKTAIKINININNLIVAHWLNILCKLGGIKWHNHYQCTVNITQLLTCTFSCRSLLTRKTGQGRVSTSVQLTFQRGVLCNRSCIVKRSRRSLPEMRSVRLLRSDNSGHSKCSERPTVKILTMVVRAQDGHAEF